MRKQEGDFTYQERQKRELSPGVGLQTGLCGVRVVQTGKAPDGGIPLGERHPFGQHWAVRKGDRMHVHGEIAVLCEPPLGWALLNVTMFKIAEGWALG